MTEASGGATNGMKRDIGALALLMTGISSILGAAWLFGAWRTAQLAGSGAVYAWLIGAVIISIVAAIFVELGTLFPEAGGMARYGYYSHGTLVGFISGWTNWISMVSVITLEAEASTQYLASWRFAWTRSLYQDHQLSATGLGFAAILIIGYFLLNFWGVRFFARANSMLTVFKLGVPLLTALALVASGFHAANFKAGIHLSAEPLDWGATLSAVATSGIVFSFNGFQNPINLAGEARNPARDIPLAVFGALALATVVYVVLQIAFIGATSPALLSAGWAGVQLTSPFAQLALALNLNWLAFLLYADAFVSPSGTGAAFTASSSRIVYAMAVSDALPRFFKTIDPVSGVPRPAMWLNLAVAFFFLYFYRGWSSLGAIISVATIISYLVGPVSVATLRRTAPNRPRPVRLPGLSLIAPLAFILATLLLYWARWPLTGEVALLVAAPAPLYIWSERRRRNAEVRRNLVAGAWLIAYMPVMAAVSALGSRQFGGLGVIPIGWDQAVVILVGLAFFAWGSKAGWQTPALSLRSRPDLTGARDQG